METEVIKETLIFDGAKLAKLKGDKPVKTFAEENGVKRQTMYDILNGRRNPSFALAVRIAKNLKVPLDRLLIKQK